MIRTTPELAPYEEQAANKETDFNISKCLMSEPKRSIYPLIKNLAGNGELEEKFLVKQGLATLVQDENFRFVVLNQLPNLELEGLGIPELLHKAKEEREYAYQVLQSMFYDKPNAELFNSYLFTNYEDIVEYINWGEFKQFQKSEIGSVGIFIKKDSLVRGNKREKDNILAFKFDQREFLYITLEEFDESRKGTVSDILYKYYMHVTKSKIYTRSAINISLHDIYQEGSDLVPDFITLLSSIESEEVFVESLNALIKFFKYAERSSGGRFNPSSSLRKELSKTHQLPQLEINGTFDSLDIIKHISKCRGCKVGDQINARNILQTVRETDQRLRRVDIDESAPEILERPFEIPTKNLQNEVTNLSNFVDLLKQIQNYIETARDDRNIGTRRLTKRENRSVYELLLRFQDLLSQNVPSNKSSYEDFVTEVRYKLEQRLLEQTIQKTNNSLYKLLIEAVERVAVKHIPHDYEKHSQIGSLEKIHHIPVKFTFNDTRLLHMLIIDVALTLTQEKAISTNEVIEEIIEETSAKLTVQEQKLKTINDSPLNEILDKCGLDNGKYMRLLEPLTKRDEYQVDGTQDSYKQYAKYLEAARFVMPILLIISEDPSKWPLLKPVIKSAFLHVCSRRPDKGLEVFNLLDKLVTI